MEMIKIHTVVVGRLQTNCYLVIDKNLSKSIIIDPGDDADYIIRIIGDEKVTPTKIIATHGHFDHIMAATELQLAYNIPLLIHKKDEFLVKRMNQTAHFFTGLESDPAPKIRDHLKEGQKIKLGKESFRVLTTPGHTPGCISLYSKKEKVAFVGDLIFAYGGTGRTDFSYSNTRELDRSIAKILKLPKQTVVLSGHGPETTIADERAYHKL